MIADRVITNGVFVIAEAGVNHNGDLDKAFELVDVAAEAGADAVKFQTFRADRLTTARAETCGYQRTGDGADSQKDMLRELELGEEAFLKLAKHCNRRGVEFMSTAFDTESLDFLTGRAGLQRIKIPSGDIVNPFALLHAARSGLPVILSTGLSDLEEVRLALGVLAYGFVHNEGIPTSRAAQAVLEIDEARTLLAARVIVLHCVSDYPAPVEDMNLRAMTYMSESFGLPVGLSDHSLGITVSVAAVALGAVVIEKHFTLDKSLPGPDHAASLDRDELGALIAAIRTVESSLGDGVKAPRASELANRVAIRSSLVARRPIAAGELLSVENLTAKRPGDGLSPMALLDLAGSPAANNFAPDELISK